MRWPFRFVYLSLTAILIVAGLLALVSRVGGGLLPGSDDLQALPKAVETLLREQELERQIDAEFHEVAVRMKEKQAVIEDLFARRYGLREALSRFEPLCAERDWHRFRWVYGAKQASHEDLLARHLIDLVRQTSQGTPELRAALLLELTVEWAEMREGQPHHAA
jgi:hypothetical protein